MPDLARSIVSRMRQLVGDRRHAKRVNVRLSFTISVVGPAVSSNGSKRVSSLTGHTMDLSATGLGLVVPTILLGEHHLVWEPRDLNVKLELPDGPIELRVAPIRYESLDEHETETGYLIGARIVKMGEAEQASFKKYVSQLLGR
jgi:hypothetical protein